MDASSTDYGKDLKVLSKLIVELAEALKGKQGDELAVWAEPLASKAVGHSYTILYLYAGTQFDDERINFVDHPSMLVLTRALMESVLTFDYVFVEPSSSDEKQFRYCAWALTGIAQRQGFPALTPEAREQLSKDKTFLANMRERIRKTKAFQQLGEKQRNNALTGKRWRPETLTKSAEKLFGPIFGGSVYGYLSAYGHSDYLAVLQVRDNPEIRKQSNMAEGGLAIACVSISKLIEGYLALWPILELIANRYPASQQLVAMYSSFKGSVGESG